jgi:RHS repeat-associated protein
MNQRWSSHSRAAALMLGLASPAWAQGPSSVVEYYHLDALGSVRVVTNQAGAVVSRHDLMPVGEEWQPVTLGREALLFTGKERDYDTGLDYFETRYFSGGNGRFTSPDRLPWWNWQHSERAEERTQFADYIGNPQNWNMYAYVLNNPLNHTDPHGMLGCQVGDQKYATCTITVVYDPRTSKGTLTVTGQNKGDKHATVLLTASVIVGGDGHVTPTGDFHAGNWQKDATTRAYGWQADTPWSQSPLGLNAFGPYQLHIRELEDRGIWIHGPMGPGWSPTTFVSGIAVSQTSHGCVRMCNRDDIKLFNMMPNPNGNPIRISANPYGVPRY